MTDALYSPNLYGQNQKTTRPHNWILIHNADKHSSVILEVAHNKDNVEIVNWHYLDDTALKQKERQAEKEGGLILTLESAAGDTQDSLSSDRKGTKQAGNLQANGGEKDATLFSLSGKDYGDTHDDIEQALGAKLPKDATVEDIDAEIKRVKELRTEANKEYLSGQPHSDVAVC